MPQRALSQDGKKHIVTVPVRLRKIQGIEPLPQHEGKNLSVSLKEDNRFCFLVLFRFSFYCCFLETYQRFS